MEVMVVMGLIVLFVGGIGMALRGSGSSTVGLQAAQSLVMSMLTQARSQAALSGRDVALLVHADPAEPEKYYRYLVVVYDDTKQPVSAGAFLPTGCYVVPHPMPTGDAIDVGSDWTGLNSTSWNQSGSFKVESDSDRNWHLIVFKPIGTTVANGRIVFAQGRANELGSTNPVKFLDPDNVRGVRISSYGQARLASSREAFD